MKFANQLKIINLVNFDILFTQGGPYEPLATTQAYILKHLQFMSENTTSQMYIELLHGRVRVCMYCDMIYLVVTLKTHKTAC